jgi:uncharacterized membrane protein
MKFKKPTGVEIIYLIFLVMFCCLAIYFFGSRGFFVGFILIYAFALKDVIKQLPEIGSKSKNKLYFTCVYFIVVTIALFTLFYKMMW